MQCSKCGHELREGAVFCPSCGQKVAAPAQNTQPVQGFQSAQSFDGTPIQPVSPVQPNDAAYPFGDNSGYTVPGGSVPPTPPVPPTPSAPMGGAVPPQIRPAAVPPAGVPAPAAKKKGGKGPLIAVICVLAAAAIGVGGFFAYKHFKKDDDSSKSDSDKVTEVVDDKIEEVLDDRDYDAMDDEEKKGVIEEVLEELKKEDYVKDFKYDPDTGIFTFTYGDGQKGSITIKPIQDLFRKLMDPNGDGDDSVPDTPPRPDPIPSQPDPTPSQPDPTPSQPDDTSSADDTSSEAPAPAPSSDAIKTKVIYGLGFPNMQVQVEENAEYWATLGMDVDYDDEGTIADFKNLAQYDYVSVELHGTWFNDQPCIVTEEVATSDSLDAYAADVDSGGLAVLRDASQLDSDWIYVITPQFFKDNYRNNELDGTTFYLGCCMAYTNPDLVEAIAGGGASTVIANDASVFTQYNILMENSFLEKAAGENATIQESLDYAKSIWGQNDFEFMIVYADATEAELYDAKDGEGPATTKIHNGADRRLR